MSEPTKALAEFAAALTFDALPPPVVERAKHCFADTVAAATFGAQFPWSRMIAAQARRAGPGGRSRILDGGTPVQAGSAALANGAAAHAFELDSLRRPGAGVHPGATLVTPLLALAQERGSTGREVITAFVAGCEVQHRIGASTLHSAERRGFHAPGLTGPLGSAAAVGRLFGLDADTLANAFGIAGSLTGGLLEFAAAGTGGMVKRLHLGRAAESGIVAASLAVDGFTGPQTILEGKYGFLNVFPAQSDPARLTKGLGSEWETLNICFKLYPCHITAQTPVEAARTLCREAGIGAESVEAIEVVSKPKVASLHNIPEPQDLIMAQYSIPWCVAAALVGDPEDPNSFGERALADPRVKALSAASKVEGGELPHLSDWGAAVTLRLTDGRTLSLEMDNFRGTPSQPFSENDLKRKFDGLMGAGHDDTFSRLCRLEDERNLAWIGA